MSRSIPAQHGEACRLPNREDGYFGWPSAARIPDGRMIIGASGLRRYHIDPWGSTVVAFGTPETGFSPCKVIHSSPLDDRDVGLTALADGSLLATWFTLDPRIFYDRLRESHTAEEFAALKEGLDAVTNGQANAHQGSWVMKSKDGGNTWQQPVRCPVSAPHGPIQLRSGRLLYLGKQFPEGMDRPFGLTACTVSDDGGETWKEIGTVPQPEGIDINQFHEPHAVECRDGSIRGYIRWELPKGGLGMFETLSTDGGATWSTPVNMNIAGSPPHVMRHSSGALVLVYGWRHPGYGQRARISRDDGVTWGEELILRDDGPDGDLGYPCSVELADGSICTVYYQRAPEDIKTSILWTKWNIPEE